MITPKYTKTTKMQTTFFFFLFPTSTFWLYGVFSGLGGQRWMPELKSLYALIRTRMLFPLTSVSS